MIAQEKNVINLAQRETMIRPKQEGQNTNLKYAEHKNKRKSSSAESTSDRNCFQQRSKECTASSQEKERPWTSTW